MIRSPGGRCRQAAKSHSVMLNGTLTKYILEAMTDFHNLNCFMNDHETVRPLLTGVLIITSPRLISLVLSFLLRLYRPRGYCLMPIYSDFPVPEGVLKITRFVIAPALYFSVLYFTVPDRKVKVSDYLFHSSFLSVRYYPCSGY